MSVVGGTVALIVGLLIMATAVLVDVWRPEDAL